MATQAQLAEAKDALHKLQTEGGVQSIETEAGKVSYKPADIRELEAYVARLAAELNPARRRRGAIGFRY